MPKLKMKSNSGAKKRFKLTATGRVKRKRALPAPQPRCARRPASKRKLRRTGYIFKTQEHQIKAMLPYGTLRLGVVRPCLAPKVVTSPVTAATAFASTPRDSAAVAPSCGKQRSRPFTASGGTPCFIAASAKGDFRAPVDRPHQRRRPGARHLLLASWSPALDKAGIGLDRKILVGPGHQRPGRLQERRRSRPRRGLTGSGARSANG